LREEKEKKKGNIRKVEDELLREITGKIVLERIDIQKGITVKALLDSRETGLVTSLEFAKKQRFKLKKIERPIYIKNVNRIFNKEKPI